MDPKDQGLVILKISPNAMKGVEIFLKNRGWKFVSTEKLKETIQFLVKYRPRYVMIPADHPNSKVRILPQVLRQLLDVTVIGYCEGTTNRALNQLAQMNLEYNLYPPVSGPQIVRFFTKVQNSLKEKQERAARAKEFNSEKDEPLVNLAPKEKKNDIVFGLNRDNKENQTGSTTNNTLDIPTGPLDQDAVDRLLAQLDGRDPAPLKPASDGAQVPGAPPLDQSGVDNLLAQLANASSGGDANSTPTAASEGKLNQNSVDKLLGKLLDEGGNPVAPNPTEDPSGTMDNFGKPVDPEDEEDMFSEAGRKARSKETNLDYGSGKTEKKRPGSNLIITKGDKVQGGLAYNPDQKKSKKKQGADFPGGEQNDDDAGINTFGDSQGSGIEDYVPEQGEESQDPSAQVFKKGKKKAKKPRPESSDTSDNWRESDQESSEQGEDESPEAAEAEPEYDPMEDIYNPKKPADAAWVPLEPVKKKQKRRSTGADEQDEDDDQSSETNTFGESDTVESGEEGSVPRRSKQKRRPQDGEAREEDASGDEEEAGGYFSSSGRPDSDTESRKKARRKRGDGQGQSEEDSEDGSFVTGLGDKNSNKNEDPDFGGKIIEVNSRVRVVNSKADTIILKGSVESLDQAIRPSHETKSSESIDESSNISCMVINSARFKGYLIVAMGKNRKVDEQLMTQVKGHLVAFLKAKGEKIDDLEADAMNVEIKKVQFQTWARDQAEFLLNSIHNANEIAVAFFPAKDVSINLEGSAEPHMLKMQLNDILEDTPLDFDIFIYLPTNGKYILYNREGRTMFGDQKSRLLEHGVTHIHLKKDSQSMVKKYKAKNYLNEKIRQFTERKNRRR